MSKFKAGDRVCVAHEDGRVGSVRHADEKIVEVIIEGEQWFFNPSDLWIIKEDGPIGSRIPTLTHDDPTTLTRRDRFATAALTALLSAGGNPELSIDDALARVDVIAANSYYFADAMEAARNKEGGE